MYYSHRKEHKTRKKMPTFGKVIIWTIVLLYSMLALGFYQQRQEAAAEAKCVRYDSSIEFWRFECPDGRKYFMQKETE